MSRVAVVDDDELAREAIAALLAAAGFSVAEFSDPRDLIDAFPEDVVCVVTDVRMEPIGGLELTRAILARHPRKPIVVISGQADIQMAVEAMKLGARDFLEKRHVRSQLAAVVQSHCAPSAVQSQPPSAVARANLERLSSREVEVLALVARGLTSPEIAGSLSISKRTVDAHRRALMAKLGASRVGHLVRLATEAGLV